MGKNVCPSSLHPISSFFALTFANFVYHCACLSCRALQSLKQKLGAATRGHLLLKKKADALMLRFRAILRKIADVCPLHLCC